MQKKERKKDEMETYSYDVVIAPGNVLGVTREERSDRIEEPVDLRLH